MNYISNQKRQTKKEHNISNKLLYGTWGCLNRWYVLCLTCYKYVVIFHLFSLLCQRRLSFWKYRKKCSYFKNICQIANLIEKKVSSFFIAYCYFFRKENINFSEVALVAVHCNCMIGCNMIARISALKYCQYYSGYLFACWKR